jgi:hypothetical protein
MQKTCQFLSRPPHRKEFFLPLQLQNSRFFSRQLIKMMRQSNNE